MLDTSFEPFWARKAHMLNFISSLPRQLKWAILLGLDIALAPAALLAAFTLHHNSFAVMDFPLINKQALPLLMGIAALLALVTNTYKIQLKAYETRAMALTAAQTVLLLVSARIVDALAGYGTPLSVFVNFGLIYFLAAVGLRVAMLQVLLFALRYGRSQTRVLIYGAGTTGRQLVAALRTDENILPVGYIDDNRGLQGSIVQGIRVHSAKNIQELARRRRVDRVLLAMPSLSRPRTIQLSRKLEDMGLNVEALPSFAQMAQGETLLDQLRPVMPGEFLGRAALDAEMPGGAAAYAGRSVLISGAGGSIGSELCRQVLVCGASKLVLFEISELALYTIDMELRTLAEGRKIEIVPVLGSVLDAALVERALSEHDVQVVLHAAAYKHVPMVEMNPIVGVSNNVLGTHTLATAAAEAKIERFILISSDKAVRPRNTMGASKRLAEIMVQDMARRRAFVGSGTYFSMVRFGNVIGSSGSVIPLFEEQIAKGGPVTLTHRDVTRYFMTISEAARLVLVAGSFGEGGDVFVLDMGDPVPIYDLARQMIEAAGYTILDTSHPNGDIEIALTGLRPGEKLHEELMIGKGELSTLHPKIMKARETQLSELEVAACLKALRAAVEAQDELALRVVLNRWAAQGEHVAAPVELAQTERN